MFHWERRNKRRNEDARGIAIKCGAISNLCRLCYVFVGGRRHYVFIKGRGGGLMQPSRNQ